MYEVYLITNMINDKKYVGVTCRRYQERYKEHLSAASSGSNLLLHNAMRKYGVENFKVSLVAADVPEDRICAAEQHYVKVYNTFYQTGHGYNMTEGGGGMCGYHHTQATRLKLSQSHKGHKFTLERNKKIKDAMTGRNYLPEWRAALSDARKGRFTKAENPFYGKQHTKVTKNRVSVANTKHAVLCIDPTSKQVIREFRNSSEAGAWIHETVRQTSLATTCECRISEVCRKGNSKSTAYGFGWIFKERSID